MADEQNDDKLHSAGTPADSAWIQLGETLAVVAGAAGVGAFALGAWTIGTVAVLIAGIAGWLAYRSRRKRVILNETELRTKAEETRIKEEEIRRERYAYPYERQQTIKQIALPVDVEEAALKLVGGPGLSRFEVAERLTIHVGRERANQYLPVILQQGDRTLAPLNEA